MASLIIFIGPPGAGKSVQAERMAADLGFVHLSSGALLRQDPAEAAVLASGQLASSEQVERIMAAAVAEVPTDKDIILDGFPRELVETNWLAEQLETWQRTIRVVIVFNVDRTVSNNRLGLRQRSDDTDAAMAERWSEYASLTQPVIAYYKQQGLVREVDGNRSVDDVLNDIGEILK